MNKFMAERRTYDEIDIWEEGTDSWGSCHKEVDPFPVCKA